MFCNVIKRSARVSYLQLRNLYANIKLNNENKESPLKKLLNDSASFEDIKEAKEWSTLPYLQNAKIEKSEENGVEKRDPRDTTIILFPGQGSQFVGMAKDLLKFPMAKDLFELANYLLKYDLLKLCLHGPKEQLDQTKYCQPALLVTSLAALERLKEERPNAIDKCVGTAGFSLGEITALIFAGALEFEKGLKLVQLRAEAMQAASEEYPGAMATVFSRPDSKMGLACIKAKEWALDKGVEVPECRIANYLFPHCKVVAGNIEAIEFLEKYAADFNIKRVKRIPVSGAFHTDLMLPAVEPFRKALNKLDISDPAIRVYSNVDGKAYRNAEHIRKQLPKQIIKPVKWEQLMHVVYQRDPDEYYPNTFECGPGTSLKAMLKQCNGKAWDRCINIEA